METFDFYGMDRYLEIFCFIILAFVAFQKKRPIFFLAVLILNSLPDLWMILPQNRVQWIVPQEQAEHPSATWIEMIQKHQPQSIVGSLLHATLSSSTPSPSVENSPISSPAIEFNSVAFYTRILFLLIALLLFIINHVHGVAGLGAFLFPTYYFVQRFFQAIDFFLPFQFNRQFALFRQNPEQYTNTISSNPSGIWMLIGVHTLFCAGLFALYYFTRKQARTYNVHIPNPENYQILLNGQKYDYLFDSRKLVVNSLVFRISDALSNQSNRDELHFASGTILRFVKREVNPPSSYGGSSK